ncbi:ribosome-binding factor A [Actinomarinicola tropica]|uniref:Ribosome-binding factor A n=1 Tax=Actinomarinicola tropica TaxID=2789776 RepID=A0A5Q2RGW7_9ACTN|nr:ribosome-binding factor A [Actinomarinicola tropica]QGG94874.1 ribosome-binding factor A [Actinomarinicola tropica]
MSKHRSNARHYPRTARLKELFREILAEELERIDDPRLEMVTVIEVDVDAALDRATLYFTAPHDPDDLDAAAIDAEALDALRAHRGRLQRALGREARIKRVPELGFEVDEVTRGAARIEEILRELPELADGEHEPADDEA